MPGGAVRVSPSPERARDRRRPLPPAPSRPGAIAPAPLLLLMQRALGNQAVNAWLGQRRGPSALVQRLIGFEIETRIPPRTERAGPVRHP